MIETSAHLVDHLFPEVPDTPVGAELSLAFAPALRQQPRRAQLLSRRHRSRYPDRPDPSGRACHQQRRPNGCRHLDTTVCQRTEPQCLPGQFIYTCSFSTGSIPGMPTDRDSIASVRPISKPLSACSTVSYTPSSTGHRAQALPPQHKIGLLIEDTEQPLAQLGLNLEPADALDLNAASIRYRIAVGQDAGGRTDSLKNPALTRTDSTPKPFTANQDSFSLNCAVALQPHQRDRLAQLCRYITRPAPCLDCAPISPAITVYSLPPHRSGNTSFQSRANPGGTGPEQHRIISQPIRTPRTTSQPQ